MKPGDVVYHKDEPHILMTIRSIDKQNKLVLLDCFVNGCHYVKLFYKNQLKHAAKV